jgi:hypothetical protein
MRKGDHNGIIDAISDLHSRGFLFDFSLMGNKLLCVQQQSYVSAAEFQVREMYRFRTYNSIYKETIIYALESDCRPLKGLLLTHQEIAE